MLLSLNNRRVYFDLAGPQNAPVVCFTHSLNSDGGMWVEQMVPLLAAGYRVLRLDMRGHGGSEPVPGDYTMDALAADVKGALDVLDIKKVHLSACRSAA
jgi:3-oxoadipate enol-lactonase